MDLDKRLRKVKDRASFLAFVAALAEDYADEVAKERVKPNSPYGPGANGWENGTIDAYLEAAHACAVDSTMLTEEPSWQAFAQFLYAGKYYE
ncbi:MAG: DUF7660 family protein [Fimbriimonas sp.]